MWSKREKALIHIYKQAAGIGDDEYRRLLKDTTGHSSAADRNLTQAEFESAMAALEARLVWAIDQGLVPAPARGKIQDLTYWRTRKPIDAIRITARQLERIKWMLHELRTKYWSHMGHEQLRDYVDGIIRHGSKSGSDSVVDLTAHQASNLIDALTDRLYYLRKEASVTEPMED